VIVAPVCVMAEAPTALMTRGVPVGAVGAGVGVAAGVGVGVGVGCRRVRCGCEYALCVPFVEPMMMGVALVAPNGITRATIPKIMTPVAIQSRARRRRGAGGVADARSSIQRVPSQNI
jgi:L-aminopeptidase/D-esterase-like protein